jgi:hypothetical protein
MFKKPVYQISFLRKAIIWFEVRNINQLDRIVENA